MRFSSKIVRDVPDGRAFAYGNHGGYHHIAGLHGQNSSLIYRYSFWEFGLAQN